MHRLIAAIISVTMAFSSLANAGERHNLGYGRLLTNDLIGDGDDRWRTGSMASSRVWGPDWSGQLPEQFGQILEYRFNGEIIAPENLTTPTVGDRRFAGVLSFGLHSHFMVRQTEISAGVDLAFTGSQTGLDDFSRALHDSLGSTRPSQGVVNNQIGNDVHPTLVIEAGRDVGLGARSAIRPFVEGRWGLETLVRAGADLTIGKVGRGELLVRDSVTGQRYRVIKNPFSGLSFVVGADVAYVSDSELLPDSGGFNLTDTRNRVRAGLHWQGENGSNAFYGLTWLDKEFEGQRDSQVVGSVRLSLKF